MGRHSRLAVRRGSSMARRGNRPIPEPHPKRSRLRAGEPERIAREALRGMERPAPDVRDREVRHVDLPRPPARCTLYPAPLNQARCAPRRRERDAEEGHLEPELLSIRRLQVPREIPPLVAECRMRTVIPRELER